MARHLRGLVTDGFGGSHWMERISTAVPDSIPSAFDTLIYRIRQEFAEMPGLALTVSQASLLFGVPRARCAELLDHLVAAGILRLTQGHYRVRSATT